MKKVLLALLRLLSKIKVIKSSCCSCECRSRENCECETSTKI